MGVLREWLSNPVGGKLSDFIFCRAPMRQNTGLDGTQIQLEPKQRQGVENAYGKGTIGSIVVRPGSTCYCTLQMSHETDSLQVTPGCRCWFGDAESTQRLLPAAISSCLCGAGLRLPFTTRISTDTVKLVMYTWNMVDTCGKLRLSSFMN